eukprot:g2598.t1
MLASLAQRRGAWGDDEDEENDVLPQTRVTGPDENGIKIVTEVSMNDKNRKVRTVKTIKVTKKQVKISKRLKERRKWKKFGNATGVEGVDPTVTIPSVEEVKIENPDEPVKDAADDIISALTGDDKESTWSQIQKKRMERKLLGSTGGGDDKDTSGAGSSLSALAAGGKGKYVPPSRREGATLSRFSDRFPDKAETTSIRVSNITEDANEQDLRELFSAFGKVQRVYLAKDKNTQQSRGFAFVSFYEREHAEKAMEHLQGYGYDHLILRLEWAKPSNKDAGSENVMRHASGYGKALPQNPNPTGR